LIGPNAYNKKNLSRGGWRVVYENFRGPAEKQNQQQCVQCQQHTACTPEWRFRADELIIWLLANINLYLLRLAGAKVITKTTILLMIFKILTER
jgi:hypothetical protein